MTSHTLTLPYRLIVRHERMLVLILGMLSIAAIGFYIYGVLGTTIEITERRNLENEIRVANTRISELEISYFNAISAITLDHAHALGFSEARTNVSFAYAQGDTAVAVLR